METKAFQKIYTKIENITKATGKDGMSIKLNAGAEKFFNEK